MTAEQALERIADHEEECRERYRQIVSNLNISAQDRAHLKDTMMGVKDTLNDKIDSKFNKLNSQLWGILLAAVIGEAGIIAAVVAWFMNYKMTIQP